MIVRVYRGTRGWSWVVLSLEGATLASGNGCKTWAEARALATKEKESLHERFERNHCGQCAGGRKGEGFRRGDWCGFGLDF